MIKCKGCQIEKHESEFYVFKSFKQKREERFSSRCRPCHSAYVAIQRKNKAEYYKQKRAKYPAVPENKEKQRSYGRIKALKDKLAGKRTTHRISTKAKQAKRLYNQDYYQRNKDKPTNMKSKIDELKEQIRRIHDQNMCDLIFLQYWLHCNHHIPANVDIDQTTDLQDSLLNQKMR